MCAQGLEFFGGEQLKGEDMVKALAWEEEHRDDRIIFISDVWLDHPHHLAQLDTVLSGAGLSPLLSAGWAFPGK